MNQEYSLQITLSTNHGDAYYYTRVVSRSATYTEQYAKFADDFVQMSLDKTQADNLAAYLETPTVLQQKFRPVKYQLSTGRYQLGKFKSAVVQSRDSGHQGYQ